MNQFNAKQEEWHQQANSSNDLKSQVGRPFSDKEWELLAKDIRDKLNLSKRLNSILDVGCGNGLLLKHFEPDFEYLAGIDYAVAMIEEAKNLLPGAEFRVGNAHNLEFESEKFNRVLCYSIFHYFPDTEYTEKALMELIRVCAKGGVVLIGDILDKTREKEIKGNSNLEYEKQIPLIHRYSEWLFHDLEKLSSFLEPKVKKVEILEQPESFTLSKYRKDLRIWI